MRVISFDVGIKNMAYCIFDISSNISQYPKIIEWNILNLLNVNDEPVPLCKQLTSKKKECGKKCKYVKEIDISGEITKIACCEVHAKKNNRLLIPQKKYSPAALKKLKIAELTTIQCLFLPQSKCTKKADILKELNSYFETHCWDMISKSKVNAGHVNLIIIGRQLYKELSKNEKLSSVTHVLIENQISPIANRMKTIQGMLAQHFISLNTQHIEFVSSGNKLKEFETIAEKETSEYQKHKKDGVFHCSKVLNQYFDQQWYTYFETYKGKRDDLADCFLQGIWWWKKMKDKEK